MKQGIALGSLLLPLLWGASAAAQDCMEDADCGEGSRCEKPVSVDGCAEPPCEPAEPVVGEVGWCLPAALGQACESDADCGPELLCLDSPDLAVDCAPDSPECERSAAPSGGKSCDYPPPEPLLCDADGACLPPLACDAEQDEPACYWPDQACESDADCGEGFGCVDGAAFAGDCGSCEDAGDGEEPVCTSEPCPPGPDQCLPSLIACEADGECPADWSCRELTYDFIAPHWGEDALGSLGCVPGGQVQLAEGNYTLGGFQTADGEILEAIPLSATSGPAATGDDGAAPGEDALPDLRGDEESDPEAAMTAESSSGCSAAQGQGQAHALGLALLGMLLVSRRRRSAAR